MIGILFEQFIQDARYAVNSLRRAPAFTAVAILTLALGIGVNAALFTIFDAVVLRPPPVFRPEQLVQLTDANVRTELQKYFSYLDFLDYRRLSASLSNAVAVWSNPMLLTSQTVQSGDPGDIRLVPIQAVTANYFSFLQAPMALGRGFLPDDDRIGVTSPTIVISARFWESYFQSAPDVLGKTVPLNGARYVVVGVASREFVGTSAGEPAGWLPIAATPNLRRSVGVRSGGSFEVIGRLKPGVAFEQAEAELNTLAQHLPPLETGHHRTPAKISLLRGLKFISLPSQASNPSAVSMLLVAFVAVLLIAGANVSNLLLARAASRQVEMATRVSIGATRGRLIRQLLTESMLLAMAGGAGALLLARWTLSALSPTLVASLQLPPGSKDWLLLNLHLDYRVFIFSFAIALILGVATGLPAAFQSYREGIVASLRDAGGLACGSWFNPSRLREALVVVQIASCLALLMGAALLLRSLQKVTTLDLGYRSENVFNVLVTPFRMDAGDILQRLPGVQSVATAWLTVPTGIPVTTAVKIVGRDGAPLFSSSFNLVSSNYFATMGMPLVRGRTFDEREVAAGVPVMVISESSARRFWPGQDPIGQHLAVSTAALSGPRAAIAPDDPTGPFTTFEVVGVVRDARNTSLREPDELYVYLPLPPGPATAFGYFIRVAESSLFSESEIRRAGHAAGLRITFGGRSLGDGIEGQRAPFRAVAYLGSLLGGLALCLATIGLFGVMSFSVSRRVREMGIRLALGAKPSEIIRLVLGQGVRLVAWGIGLGVFVAAALSRLLTHWMVEVTPLDPTALASVAVVLAGATLLACFLPARRASRIDPMVALRCD